MESLGETYSWLACTGQNVGIPRTQDAVYNVSMATARDIILQYGWNSTAYQILNPGIEHWFAPRQLGMVGFVRRQSTWVAAGAPVCRYDQLGEVAGAFEEEAARADRRVCYVCAAERLAEHARRSPRHAMITIGAQPVWHPGDWPEIVRARPSLRAQLNRAINKGVSIQPWGLESSVGAGVLGDIARRWLAARPMPAMGFLVESPALGEGGMDRAVFVALRRGTPVAFLAASPVPLRNGFLIEQIARLPGAPNGTAELLIDAAMRRLASDGRAYVTMGLVALSTQAQQAMDQNPMWIRMLMGWARAHGRRFYHFDGLEHFRTKMVPREWETIYAIVNEPQFSPMALWSMAAAFAHGSPLRAMARVLGKGLRTEAGWLWRGAAAANA